MIENIPISKLTLLENNPRRITKEQMDKLCKSIKEDPDFLKCRPVLVNCIVKSCNNGVNQTFMNVYAGNQRVRAAKKLKMKEVPCVVDHDLPQSIQDARCIKDNKTYGDFDFDELGNNWDAELLIDCGFKPEEILGPLDNISDDERAGEKNKKSKLCPHCGREL